MLVPVLEDDASSRRAPWLCLALALLWTGLHAATLAGAGPAPERFGLAPDAPSLPGVLTYFALHVHTPHLALSLALLLLAVAPLECRRGPLLTGAFGALLVVLGGGVYVLLTDGSERPLVGPSAALTGLAVAAIATFFRDGLRFEVPLALGGGRRPGFRLPAPAIAAVWFVGEVTLEVLSDVSGPTRGIHYGANAAAALCGAAGVWALGRAGPDAPGLRPRTSAKRDAAADATLARARTARDEDRPDAALDELRAAVAASPHDERLVAALWETACAAGRRDDARETALRFVADAWRRGEREPACAVWRAVIGAEPGAPLDVRLRLGLAPALHEAGHRAEAARTLHGALADARALTPGTALRLAEAARSIHPPTGVEAARRALATEGLDESKRARIADLIASLEAEPANLEDVDLGTPPPPPEAGPRGTDAAGGPEDPAPGLAEPGTRAADAAPPDADETPEDPYALRLDDTDAEADAPLELGADGALAAAEEDSPFGAVDLDASDADAVPEPVAAPPLAGAPPASDAGRDPATRSLPSLSAEPLDADAEPPDPGALDPAALDLGAEPDTATPDLALDGGDLAAPPGGDPEALDRGAGGDDGDADDDGLDDAALDAAELEALAGFEDLGDVGDLAGPPEPRFAATKVIEAVPRALRDDALEVASEGGSASRLPLARVEAVAVAGVGDLAARPVVVIDLLFNWSAEDGGPLKVARLRSDRFDPQALASAPSPVEAVRALAAALLERSGAVALPDPEAARGRPFAMFDTLAAYEREVLRVGS